MAALNAYSSVSSGVNLNTASPAALVVTCLSGAPRPLRHFSANPARGVPGVGSVSVAVKVAGVL